MRVYDMKQTAGFISTYAADVSGVCSALFELGGMTVMHDASGCNSTYNTHDEPRWFDMDSMVYISGLSEIEAIMGDDDKLIGDIVSAAEELAPRFIAVAGSPIPMVTGMDFDAVAAEIEARTGIPAFGFSTNGMHSYLMGVSRAFEAFAERMVQDSAGRKQRTANILGLTPLDFSVNGSAESIRIFMENAGYEVVSSWAMGSCLEDVERSAEASVNLVVSYSGLEAARVLKKRFGTPYVVGVPIGSMRKRVEKALKAAENGEGCGVSYDVDGAEKAAQDIVVVGESVFSRSLAQAVEDAADKEVSVVCPLETEMGLLADRDRQAQFEEEIAAALRGFKMVIADPLYRPVAPKNASFISLPHEAFSGRMFRKDIPNLVDGFDGFLNDLLRGVER